MEKLRPRTLQKPLFLSIPERNQLSAGYMRPECCDREQTLNKFLLMDERLENFKPRMKL